MTRRFLRVYELTRSMYRRLYRLVRFIRRLHSIFHTGRSTKKFWFAYMLYLYGILVRDVSRISASAYMYVCLLACFHRWVHPMDINAAPCLILTIKTTSVGTVVPIGMLATAAVCINERDLGSPDGTITVLDAFTKSIITLHEPVI